MNQEALDKSACAAALRARIRDWRRGASGRRPHMPKELWNEAVALADSNGLSPTARFLGLNHETLRARLVMLRRSKAAASLTAPAFVELGVAAPGVSASGQPHSGAVLELTGVGGSEVYQHTYGVSEGVSNVCGNEEFPDELVQVSATITDGTSDALVTAATNLDSEPLDESWGLQDVEVLVK